MELCTRKRADRAGWLRRDNQIKRRTKEDQVHLSDVERFEYTLTPIIAADPKSNVSSAVVDNLTRYHTIDNKENLGGKKKYTGRRARIRTFEHRDRVKAIMVTTAIHTPCLSGLSSLGLSYMTSAMMQNQVIDGPDVIYTHAMQKPEKGGTHAWRARGDG